MNILNLYSGIGGNRKLWKDVKVTAIELNSQIANIYQGFFPSDKVIVEDAHQYLLHNYKEFDFLWSSPPCPTHSRMRLSNKNKVYPDMTLYQEIIFLKHNFKGNWIVENVIPYYQPLIKPITLNRHCFWSNFHISLKEFPKMHTCKIRKEREFLQKQFGFNLDKATNIDKRKVLRNCVLPELGLHILNASKKPQNNILF